MFCAMKKLLCCAVSLTVALSLFPGPARAADSLSYMSFTLAEEANRTAMERLMNDFTARTGVKVDAIPTAWGDILKNVFLRQRSHTLPTVVQLSERWLNTVAGMKEAVDLNTVFGREALEKLIDPNILALGRTVDGRQLALPIATGSFNLVANVAVLKKAGITELPKTYDEFKKALVAVRDKVPNSVPFGFCTQNPNSVAQDYVFFVRAFGGQVVGDDGSVQIDSAANRQAVSELTSMMKDHLIAPEIDRPDARRLFGQDAVAFYVDAVQARSFARSFSGQGEAFDSHIAPMSMPVVKPGDIPKSVQWGHTLVTFSDSAAAKRFLTFFLSDDVQIRYAKLLAALPVTRTARNDADIQNDKYLAEWAKHEGVSVVNDVSICPNAVELTNILSEGLQSAMLGQKSVDDAIADMSKRMNDSMAKLKK